MGGDEGDEEEGRRPRCCLSAGLAVMQDCELTCCAKLRGATRARTDALALADPPFQVCWSWARQRVRVHLCCLSRCQHTPLTIVCPSSFQLLLGTVTQIWRRVQEAALSSL